MKKIFFISMATLVLGACTNDNTTTDVDTTSSSVEVTESMTSESSMVSESSSMASESSSMEGVESEDMDDADVSDEDLADVPNSDLESAESVSEYAAYEELAAQDVFNPADYDGHLVTDNPGTRIFLFRNGDMQMYKTIFVKNNNRLKVIDLQADQMVYNEQIN